jgi:hypothetical protein
MRKLFKYLSLALILELIITLTLTTPVLAAGTITLSSSSDDFGPVGTTVTIQGTGFTVAENVAIVYDRGNTNEEELTSFLVPSSGAFSKSVKIPTSKTGEHTIRAIEGETVYSNSLYFTVTPSITLSKTTGTTGTSVTVYGWGFDSAESVVTTLDGHDIGSAKTANTVGYWSNTITIPYWAPASYTFGAYGDTTDAADVQDAAFSILSSAAISLNKTTGAAGSSLTVTGTGFVGGESNIVVTFDNTPAGTLTTASSTGTWSIIFNTPAVAGGPHTIDAYGAVTKASDVADKSFSVSAGMSISKTSGPPGAQITVTGAGFAPNETGINVTWDGAPIGNPVNAGPTGAWTSTITVPATSAGPHTINAYGSTTSSGGPDLSFTIGAGISTSETSGTIGTTVSVSGSGFGVSEKGILISFDGTTVASNITANTSGAWLATFDVPPSAGGEHFIDASGSITQSSAIQDQSFTTLPGISLDMVNGSSGSAITVNGSGFTPNLKGIAVMFDDQELASGIKASAMGTWTATCTVPPAASGSHTISIAGAGISDLSIDTLSFKIKPAASLFPETGTIGTKVVITGTGFIANGNLQFTFDDVALSVSPKGTADAKGNINKSFIVPEKIISGEHVVRVSDGTNSEEMVFTIDTAPPPTPEPISPADGKRIGFISSTTPTFTWAKVTSANPVSYTFQLDSDPEFSNPLEKSGLTVTKYTLSNADALPRGEYYWRVKAVDIVSNESPWSQPWSFKSGLMSPALFIPILIVVIAALIVGGYFLITRVILRRRRAAASSEIVIPEIVNADFRQVEGEKRTLPWRLALPQAPQQSKGSKTLSSEDQARLRTIIDFAKSLPLPQPDSSTGWLIELAENNTGNAASPALYSQLLKNEIQVRYEPAWMQHPTFLDLQALLEGQPIMQDLTSYVDAVNRLATDATQILHNVYHDAAGEVALDLLSNDGWAYISGIYTDGVAWFQGKNLREPSDRDYSIKTESATGEQPAILGLYGDQNTAFAGLLVKANDQAEVQQLRSLHLKLRRNYRNSGRLRELVSLISQMEVQRNRLLAAFSQFNRLNT